MPQRVVLLSLDAFDHRLVGPETTPRLSALAESGGLAPDGGRTALPAVTYVSHATMLTGRLPSGHGETSNLAGHPRPGVVPGWAGQATVQVPTLFALLGEAGVRTGAVFGDQYLHAILRADAAATAWPPHGEPPPGADLDAHGYLTNAAIRPHLLALAADPETRFLFAHLNETDTWGHRFGPGAPETVAAHREADALVGEVVDALAVGWDETLVVVLSDHGMEPVGDGEPIDLRADPVVARVLAETVEEGGSVLCRLAPGVTPGEAAEVLRGVRGVAAIEGIGPGVLRVDGEPGVGFAHGPAKAVRGFHGGPATVRTTALVGGGHPAARRIGAAIAAEPPHVADWAPTIARLLGTAVPDADGRDLLGGDGG